ncbi:MAG: hypothetical protein EU529_13680 [Promethearchaeota archaeon]|nr:MAG: hypothetical protein EU529_13680 [Candidatus Lokiarchaeota archaeon]
MNEMIVIGLGIFILIIVAKCVILLRFLQKLSKKSYIKYQKFNAKTQLKKIDSERVKNRMMESQIYSESKIIQDPDFLTFNTEIFY